MIVRTSAGMVEGEGTVFKGIPYAARPVRWAPPMPPAPWPGVRPAVEFGRACPQLGNLAGTELQDEDCLYLNVWTPSAEGLRPVMVWFHGGGYCSGSASQPEYDGARLSARGDVAVVTANYRLGALGFLRVPGRSTGNEGLLDAVASLEWVRENIAAFGGDPANVTVFGESAGGAIVTALMAMPRASGLFHKAIAMSGTGMRFVDAEGAEGLARDLADLEDLRTLVERAGESLRPVIDGDVLPRRVHDAIAAGSSAGIPLMAGTTRDERAMGMPARAMDDDELRAILRRRLPAAVDVETMIRTYWDARAARPTNVAPRHLAVAITTDALDRVPTIRLLEAQRAHAPATHHYIFGWTSPLGDGAYGAMHAVDMPFTFGTHDATPVGRWLSGRGPAADAVSAAWQDGLTAFARSGDPSCGALGTWPAYGDSRSTLLIGERTRVEDAPYEAERAAWDAYSNDVLSARRSR